MEINDMVAEAIGHEREAQKCRMLVDQAQQIAGLKQSLAKANEALGKKQGQLEAFEKEKRNGKAHPRISCETLRAGQEKQSPPEEPEKG